MDRDTLPPRQPTPPPPAQAPLSTHTGNLSMLADAALAASSGGGTGDGTATLLQPKEGGSTSTLLGVLNPPAPVLPCTGSTSSSTSGSGTGFACSDMNRLYVCLLAEISKLYRQNEETHRTIAQLRDVLSDSRRREQAIESQLQAVVQHLRAPPQPAPSMPPALPPLAHPSTFAWDVLHRPQPPPDAPPPAAPAAAQAPHPSLILPDPQLHGRPGLPQLPGNNL